MSALSRGMMSDDANTLVLSPVNLSAYATRSSVSSPSSLDSFSCSDSNSDSDSQEERRKLAASSWNDVCTRHGFSIATLPLGRITPELLARTFDVAKQLFTLDDDAKMKLRRHNPADNMGYAPLGGEAHDTVRGADRKEAFNVRSRRCHTNDYTGCPPDFQPVVEEFWDALEDTARALATCAADAIGVESDFFAKTLKSWEHCTIRFLHYPACDFGGDEGSSPIRCGCHMDFGLFTLLFVKDGESGLQLKAVDGSVEHDDPNLPWRNVQLPASEDPNGVVMLNTGALLARWTNDAWRATAHRVVVPSEAQARQSRYSIAFFVDPDPEMEVAVHEKLGTPKYAPILAGEYLRMRLDEIHLAQKK